MESIAWKEADAAAYIGMSRGYLRQDRMYGDTRPGRTPGPKYLRINRSIRYLKADLDQWLEQHRI